MNAALADTVLAWLATYAIHSTVLIGATAIVTRLAIVAAPARDFAWKLALVGALFSASAQLAVDVRPWGSVALEPRPAAAPATASPLEVSDENVRVAPGRTHPDGPPLPDSFTGRTPAPVSDANVRVAPGRSQPDGPPAANDDAAGAALVGTTDANGPDAGAGVPPLLTAIALGAWLVGALVLALAWVVRRVLLAGRLTTRQSVTEGRLRAHLDRLLADTGHAGRVRLTSAPTIASPVALGRDEICVPAAALTDLDDEQMRGLLAHELAHLVRRDPLWLDVASLIERVFFFQPLNRLARAGFQRNAEFLCDDWAAARNGGGEPLARCLARVAEWIEAAPLGVPVAGMAEQRSLLVSRIARLLEGTRMKSPLSRATMALLTAGAIGALVLAVPAVHRVAQAEPAPEVSQAGTRDTMDRTGDDARLRADLGRYGAMELRKASRMADLAAVRELRTARLAGAIARDLRDPADTVEQDPSVVSALIERLTDTHASVRRAAASSLGSLRAHRAVPALATALADKSWEVRVAAAEALGGIQDAKAIPALVKLLADENANVREAGIDALQGFNEEVPVAAVVPVLADSRPRMRQAAASILGSTGDRAALAPLVKALKDPVAVVRQSAIEALQRLHDPSVARELQPLLADESAAVRLEAMEALRELGASVPEAALLKALDDPSAEVRQRAASLAHEEAPSAAVVAALRKLVTSDPNADVRTTAIEALAEARHPQAREAIKAALTSGDARVRRAAAEALGQRP